MFECAMMQQFYAPDMYWRNPYNVLGLPISASARDVRRRLEDILGMMSIGNSRQSACVAILPKRLNLDVKDIEALAELLVDPYSRAFYTLFWFWPAEDIESKSDEAINRIVTGRPEDRKWALSHWYDIVDADEDTAEVLIAKHNLAVYFHLVSLMFEDDFIHGGVITSSDCERYWKQAIAYWDQVADNDYFWDIFEEGCISQFDDPRMTSGFVRSFRHDFPLGFDQINASLLKIYIEKKDAENVARQIKYMKQSQCGLDDVESSLEFVASGVEKSIFRFLDNKTSEIGACEREGAALAEQILEHYASIEKIVALLSAETSLNADAIKDRVAMAAQHCVVAYGNKTENWEDCVPIIHKAINLACGESVLTKLRKNLEIVCENNDNKKVEAFYRSVGSYILEAEEEVKKRPETGLDRARFILEKREKLMSGAFDLARNVSSFSAAKFADRIALVAQSCVVLQCNSSKDCRILLKGLDLLKEIKTIAIEGVESVENVVRNINALVSIIESFRQILYKDIHTLLDGRKPNAFEDSESAIAKAEQVLLGATDIVERSKVLLAPQSASKIADDISHAIEMCIIRNKIDAVIDVGRCNWILTQAVAITGSHRLSQILPADDYQRPHYNIGTILNFDELLKTLLRDAIDIWRRNLHLCDKCVICGSPIADVQSCYCARVTADVKSTDLNYNDFRKSWYYNISHPGIAFDVTVPRCERCKRIDEHDVEVAMREMNQIKAELNDVKESVFCINRRRKSHDLVERFNKLVDVVNAVGHRYESYPLVVEIKNWAYDIQKSIRPPERGYHPRGKLTPIDWRPPDPRCCAALKFGCVVV